LNYLDIWFHGNVYIVLLSNEGLNGEQSITEGVIRIVLDRCGSNIRKIFVISISSWEMVSVHMRF
jgi:hypothetical protein